MGGDRPLSCMHVGSCRQTPHGDLRANEETVPNTRRGRRFCRLRAMGLASCEPWPCREAAHGTVPTPRGPGVTRTPASHLKGPPLCFQPELPPWEAEGGRAGGRAGDSLSVPQAEGLDAVRCQGPAHPDLLVPVSGEDEAVIRTHGLCAGERAGRSWDGQSQLPASRLQPLGCTPFLVHSDATAPTRVSLLPPPLPPPARRILPPPIPHVQPVTKSW